jgi:hypothetical protein
MIFVISSANAQDIDTLEAWDVKTKNWTSDPSEITYMLPLPNYNEKSDSVSYYCPFCNNSTPLLKLARISSLACVMVMYFYPKYFTIV